MRLSTAQLNVPAPDGEDPDAPLQVQVLVLEDDAGTRLVLVGGDIIWFSDEMAGRLRRSIASLARVSSEAVILSATHTHGSPQPDARFPFGRKDPEWVARFEQIVMIAAHNALSKPAAKVVLSRASVAVEPDVAVHRRRVAWHFTGGKPGRRAQTLPNPAREIDTSLKVLVARDGDDRVRAVVVHMPCHPVSLPRDMLGADYPGFLRQSLQAVFGFETVVLFLQGHCGDIRPRLVHEPRGLKDRAVEWLIGPRFRPSRLGDAEAIAAVLGGAARKAVAVATPVRGVGFAATRDQIALRDDHGTDTGRTLDVTLWKLADGLSFVAASGEMLSGLAAPDRAVWSIGYCNGMTGYIAPAEEYADGGYEIDGFLAGFGLARRFSIESGRQFEETRASLFERVERRRSVVAA